MCLYIIITIFTDWVNFADNKISEINSKLLEGNTEIRTLLLSNNSLRNLPNKLLQGSFMYLML